jgi:hypothetical protein
MIKLSVFSNLICVIDRKLVKLDVVCPGVLQGYVIACLLFLSYINDIAIATTNCDIALYADDSTINIYLIMV